MFQKIPDVDSDTIANGMDVDIPCWCRLSEGEKSQTAIVKAYGPKFNRVKIECPKCGRYTTGPNISEALNRWESDKWRTPHRMFMAYRDAFRYMHGDGVDRGAFTITMGSILIIGLIIGGVIGFLI